MPRRGWHPPRRGSRESPSPQWLTRTASFAHALADYVLREVWFRALHAAPPVDRPNHTGRPEILVKHLLAPLASVPCLSLRFLKVVTEALRFMHLSPDACWRGQLGLRGLRSLCWRCARLGGWLALGGAGSTGRALCGLLSSTLCTGCNLVAVVGVPCNEPSGRVGQCGHRPQTPFPVVRRRPQDPSWSHRRRQSSSTGMSVPHSLPAATSAMQSCAKASVLP